MKFGFGRNGGKGDGLSRRQPTHICKNCICPDCKTVIPHKSGIPCFQTTCLNCGKFMTIKFNTSPNE